MAKLGDPRAFLKKKLGAAGFAKFEEGMRDAAKSKGGKARKADVEGQSSCGASCASYCDANSFLQSGAFYNLSI